MDLTVTIPADKVADLQAFMVKRLAVLYPSWDTSGVDVLQVMLDDHVQDQGCEATISAARWAIYEATTDAERVAAEQAESDARDAKLAAEAARALSRTA